MSIFRCLFFILFVITFFSCNKTEIVTKLKVDMVTINDSTVVNYKDSLVFCFSADDNNSILSFDLDQRSFNNNLFLKSFPDNNIHPNFLQLDTTITKVKPIVRSDGYAFIKPSIVFFNFSENDFIDSIEIAENYVNFFDFEMNDNSRGIIKVLLYNRWGEVKINKSIFKTENDLHLSFDVSSFEKGVYVGIIKYGNEERIFNVLLN